MGYIGKIRRVIEAVDLEELGEAVPEAVPSPEQAAPAAAPEPVPA